MGRRGELMRRFREARAELTPGFERRQARRAANDARYGECAGGPGEWCPRHGRHEPDPVAEPERPATPLDWVVFRVPLVLMLGVGVIAIVWDWSLWWGAAAIVLVGPVLDRVLYRVRDRMIARRR